MSTPAAQLRRQARILAMQALCQFDAQGDAFLPNLARFLSDAATHETDPALTIAEKERSGVCEHAERLTRQTWAAREKHDRLLKRHVTNWEPSRIGLVDRAVLRLAMHEMLDESGVPPRAAMNEAIEIARQFGTVESPRFVNGVLDAILRAEKLNTT